MQLGRRSMHFHPPLPLPHLVEVVDEILHVLDARNVAASEFS
jgi:hypothetical protein